MKRLSITTLAPRSAIQVDARSSFCSERILRSGFHRTIGRPSRRPAKYSNRSPKKIPATQARTPGRNPSMPEAISAPVAMQVRSSLTNVARAMRMSCPMDFLWSGGTRQ